MRWHGKICRATVQMVVGGFVRVRLSSGCVRLTLSFLSSLFIFKFVFVFRRVIVAASETLSGSRQAKLHG